MPAGYVSQIDSIAHHLEHMPDTPSAVRRAAQTVREFPPDEQLKGR